MCNEYLVTEYHIIQDQLKGRLRLTIGERKTLGGEINPWQIRNRNGTGSINSTLGEKNEAGAMIVLSGRWPTWGIPSAIKR